MPGRLKRLIGPKRGQLEVHDFHTLGYNTLAIAAGEGLTRLYGYVSTHDLGANTQLYALLIAGMIDMFRRLLTDNSKVRPPTLTVKPTVKHKPKSKD